MTANADLQSALAGHNTTFKIMLMDMMANAQPGVFAGYTDETDAGEAQILTLAFLSNMPLMSKWLASRVRKEPRAYTQTIKRTPYAATWPVRRIMVTNDQSGAIAKGLQQFAKNTVDFYDQEVSDSYYGNSGVGPTGFDDVALFSASHPYGNASGGTQSNLSAATNLSHANLIAAETTGGLLQEENGRLYRINFNELSVGLRLRRRAQELVGNDRVVVINQAGTADVGAVDTNVVNAAATRTNVLNGDYNIVVDTRQTGYHWTLRDTTKAKPMILFKIRAPEVINKTEMTDSERFENDRFVFGVEADIGVGAGFWPSVHRGTGTA